MASLAGKVAIITGASRGIGRAMSSTGYAYALKLAGDGASLVVNYAGNAGKAQEVVAEIETVGSRGDRYAEALEVLNGG